MMNRGRRLPFLLLAAGCMTGPSQASLRARSPSPPGDAYACVLRALTAGEYQVLASDRDGGVIRAERALLGSGASAFAGAQYYLILSVTVLPGDGASDIALLASKAKESAAGGRTSSGIRLLDKDLAEARALLERCGEVGPGGA